MGGFTGCHKTKDHTKKVKIEHVGGAPYALRPVVPFVADVADQGWWSATETREFGDTIWTDETGLLYVAYPPQGSAWSGLLCELSTSWDSGAWYACKLEDSANEDVVSCTLPSSAHVRFTGNRSGGLAHPGFWINEASEPALPAANQWFTPGVAPMPSLVLPIWVHPDEPLPAQRTFHLIDANGTSVELPVISIHSEHFGDTIVQPISF